MPPRPWRSGLLAALLGAMAGACGVPHDPEGTLDRVRGGTVRVGVVHAPPFAATGGREVGGVEPDLVRELAREIGARPVFVSGAGGALLAALEEGELDLVVGGLLEDDPWDERVAFTRPWLESAWVRARSTSGPVTIARGTAAAHDLHDEDVDVRRVADPRRAEGAVAARRWELEAWGLEARGEPFRRDQHVWAVRRGENAWLEHIEGFLEPRRRAIRARLVSAAR